MLFMNQSGRSFVGPKGKTEKHAKSDLGAGASRHGTDERRPAVG